MSRLIPHQVVTLLGLGLASIRQRGLRAFTTLLGTACVVAMFVSLLSIAEGYRQVVQTTTVTPSVLVLMNGATAEIASSIGGDAASLVRQMPEIARTAAGQPMFSAEVFTTARLAGAAPGSVLTISVRGVEPADYELTGVRVAEGRLPRSGRREVLVGRLAAGRLAGTAVGDKLQLANGTWEVVGRFAAQTGMAESEVWADAGALASALDRGSLVQALHLRLAEGTTLQDFSRQLQVDPRLDLRAYDTKEYVSAQSHALQEFLHVLCFGICGLMALGAAFAALGTSYASISARVREIGTLKALGFTDRAIFAAAIGESVLLTALGGLVGAVGATIAFDGLETSTVLHSNNYSQVAFAFRISSGILAQATLLAIAIGVAGSFYPAWKVLRITISQSLAERR